MIFVRHTEECASKPVGGKLTSKCNCKTAKLDSAARSTMERLLEKLSDDSIDADEASEYFALRLDALGELIAQKARNVRRTARHADREGRLAFQRAAEKKKQRS